MPDHTDKINLDEIVFDNQNVERRSWSCLGQACSRSSIVFLSQFFVILLTTCSCFGVYIWPRLVTNLKFGLESCAAQQDTFYLHQSYEQVNFYKKPHFYISGWTERFWQNVLDTWVFESWNILTQVWQNLFFLSTPPTTLICYAKRNWHSWVCSRCTLWIYQVFEK